MQTERNRIRIPDFENQRKIYLSQCIYLLGIFVKQFYVMASGNLQPGDMLIMLGCGLYVLVTKKARYDYDKTDTWFYLFFFFVFVINSIYFILLKNNEFITSTLFYLFNTIVIFTYSGFMREENRENFLRGLNLVLKVSLAIQTGLYVLGLGNWMDHARYVGTFTDPNQYGVFVFFSVLQIYVTDHLLEKRSWIIWSVLGTIILLPSASTGTMLGMVLFWVGLYFSNFRSMRRIWKMIWGLLTFLLVLTFLVLGLGVQLPKEITSHFMYQRVIEKFNKVTSSSSALIRDRAWNRIEDHPEYFLYGSGEGYNKRFNEEDLELHSSILAPAHAYGILPYLFLVIWVFKKARHTRFLFIYIAMFGEAMFVVNTRQPFFWMTIILAGVTTAALPVPEEEDSGPGEEPHA